MKISGSVVVPHPVEAVWDAILDPAVLVRTIPGCSRLETVGENSYAMTVTAGVAAIKGTYDGTATLSDLDPGKSLVMTLNGAGAPGTIGATVEVALAPVEGGTEVSYDADAIVGGMVGGVGQRMLTSVSKRMAGEFFNGIGNAISGLDTASPNGSPYSTDEGAGGRAVRPSAAERLETPAPSTPAVGQVFTREGASTGSTTGRGSAAGSDEFMRGIAVGAGLVLLGVVAGRLSRR